MISDRELIAIVIRLLNGHGDKQDIEQLHNWKQTSFDRNVNQQAKYIVNIGEAEGIKIGDSLDTELLEEIRDLLRSQSVTPDLDIDWQEMSQVMLEEYQRLTTNPLTAGEGVFHSSDRVYVPLGLVERQRKARHTEDVSPEKGSELYQETEITQRFENEEFLEQVLKLGQSPKSQGKRIAIIGEPGAGKTTLLQQIAQWITKQVEDAIVIWISLADLRGQELEFYLLEKWLQAVTRRLRQAEVTPQIKDSFVNQFQQGRVWLLLDGVDEMQVASINPLSEISQQVRIGGLLSQAKIVLTCRVNLWDGNVNALDTFDAYRTLEFSYPKQVEQFIGNWFSSLSSAETQTGRNLCIALKEQGKERIRDLVKNPLRVTLLCFNWYLGNGKLPETKAGLYEQFVDDFYEWKREQFTTTGKQRRQLNEALGELAREAIDKDKARFRLRQDFVCEYLGEPDNEDSLFSLALRLGWLNKVGVDGDNPRKEIYAFFHPTFQEYFAAKNFCDREDYHALFTHIGEKHWREIFLLAAGISPGGNKLLLFMKLQTEQLLAKDRVLQKFLAWVKEKADSGQLYGDLSLDTRIAYFTLISFENINLRFIYPKRRYVRTHLRAIMNWLGKYKKHDDLDVRNYLEIIYHGSEIFNAIEEAYGRSLILDLIIYSILKSHNNLMFIRMYKPVIERELILKDVDLKPEMRKAILEIRNKLLSFKSEEEYKIWEKNEGIKWIKKLKRIAILHYNIGQEYEFTLTQKSLLKQYSYNNFLLRDCLNYCCLNDKQIDKIKADLFSPIVKPTFRTLICNMLSSLF